MSKTKHHNKTRRLSGSVNRLAVYDGSNAAGYLVQTDDNNFQVYGADGYPAGVFNNLKDAARSLPRAPESAS